MNNAIPTMKNTIPVQPVMTNGSVRFIGFTLASFVLISLAKVAPGVAVYLSVALLLGVTLSHSQIVAGWLNNAAAVMNVKI